jgi:hypothetical protein
MSELEAPGTLGGVPIAPVDNRWGRLHVRRVRDLPAGLEISAATRSRQRGQLLAYAQASSVNPWRHITFYADRERGAVLWTMWARWPLLVANSYRIRTGDNHLIATASKESGKTYTSAVFHVATPWGPELRGKDDNVMRSNLRKFVETGGPVAFRFVDGDDDTALTVQRGWGRNDAYLVDIPKLPGGRQLDWRVAASMAAAIDVFLNRM